MTWIIVGIVVYLGILFLFVRFGKFLKELDEETNEMMHERFVDKVERGENP